jgi:hypothetical protein
VVLNLILTTVTLASALGMAVVSLNREVAQATNTALRENKISGCSLAIIYMISGLVVAVLWTVYAFQVKDWRFAAIFWIPIVFRWISRYAEKRLK